MGRGQALGAGREDSDSDQRGTHSHSAQKKTSIFRYQQMTLREKSIFLYLHPAPQFLPSCGMSLSGLSLDEWGWQSCHRSPGSSHSSMVQV